MKDGFTLIELLVVVLIIGILAAIAVPQYFKIIEKSRSGEAYSLLRAVCSSIERYSEAKGLPTDDIDSLDISAPGTKTAANVFETDTFAYDIRNLGIGNSPENFEVVATRKNATAARLKYYLYRTKSNMFFCVALVTASEETCTGMGGIHPSIHPVTGHKYFQLLN